LRGRGEVRHRSILLA